MQVNWKAILATAFTCAGAVNLKLSFNEKLEGQVERVVTTSVFQDFSDAYAHEKGDDLRDEASGRVKPNEKLSARAALSALLGTRALYCDPGYGYCDSTSLQQALQWNFLTNAYRTWLLLPSQRRMLPLRLLQPPGRRLLPWWPLQARRGML